MSAASEPLRDTLTAEVGDGRAPGKALWKVRRELATGRSRSGRWCVFHPHLEARARLVVLPPDPRLGGGLNWPLCPDCDDHIEQLVTLLARRPWQLEA